MDRGKIVTQAFLRLGNNNVYNDNKTTEYEVATAMIDSISLSLAAETSFLFNAITVKINATGQNDLGENRFNLPVDCLNVIRANAKYRLEGEFIYSPESVLSIQYCRKLPLEEFPDNLYNLLVLALAKEMSVSFNTYNDRYQMITARYEEEKRNVLYQQGFSYEPWEE